MGVNAVTASAETVDGIADAIATGTGLRIVGADAKAPNRRGTS